MILKLRFRGQQNDRLTDVILKWIARKPITEYQYLKIYSKIYRNWKPIEIVNFNEKMSGVDKCDQMVSYYSSPRKTCKWYKKVILHLLDIAVWNTYHVYKKKLNAENKNVKDLISLLKYYKLRNFYRK